MLDYVPELTAQNRHLTAQMECHWGAGCPAEPVTITPEGAGPLAMGAGVEDLRGAAPAAAVSLGGRSSCSSISWTSPSGVTVRGAVMEDGGLVYVAGQEGVQTAEGLRRRRDARRAAGGVPRGRARRQRPVVRRPR